jgi:hypothetical protein
MNFKPYAARVAKGRLVSAEGGPVEGPNLLLVRHAHSVSNARGDWGKKEKEQKEKKKKKKRGK